ncbi:hypothetical protein K474DRAFT_1135009 [Panus rudis PR-1116 ss-1]|nr:hypothetical protein K474DRAFT_1135009 [Panus rudis PR-1116 ss-1]
MCCQVAWAISILCACNRPGSWRSVCGLVSRPSHCLIFALLKILRRQTSFHWSDSICPSSNDHEYARLEHPNRRVYGDVPERHVPLQTDPEARRLKSVYSAAGRLRTFRACRELHNQSSIAPPRRARRSHQLRTVLSLRVRCIMCQAHALKSLDVIDPLQRSCLTLTRNRHPVRGKMCLVQRRGGLRI